MQKAYFFRGKLAVSGRVFLVSKLFLLARNLGKSGNRCAILGCVVGISWSLDFPDTPWDWNMYLHLAGLTLW